MAVITIGIVIDGRNGNPGDPKETTMTPTTLTAADTNLEDALKAARGALQKAGEEIDALHVAVIEYQADSGEEELLAVWNQSAEASTKANNAMFFANKMYLAVNRLRAAMSIEMDKEIRRTAK